MRKTTVSASGTRLASLCGAALLAACSGGSAPDLSALDDPKSANAFVVATAELAEIPCETRVFEIGQKTSDGTYRHTARVNIGTSWAPATGVQTTLPPGEYHVIGMSCTSKGNTFMTMPGRREASAVPFNPIYKDSIASFTVAAGEVVSLGAFRLAFGETVPFAVTHGPLPPDTLAAARQAHPKVRDRLVERKPVTLAASVAGRCVAGNAPMDCLEMGRARKLCTQQSPAAEDPAVTALRARLKAIICG